MSLSKIWVFVEPSESGVSTTSLELVTAASGFASTVEAFSYGVGSEVGQLLGEYGASKVVVATGLNGVLAGTAVASIMARRIQAEAPDAIFFGSTPEGRDAAARLSAKLGLPVLTNVVNLSLDGGALLSENAIFGGSEIVSARFTSSGPGLYVIRAKSFAPEAGGGGVAVVEEVAVGDIGSAGKAKIVQSHVEARSGPKLDEAPVVVSGGRGLGQQDSYQMIEELARLLNGAPGASRAIVDAGWVPYAYQVGQTGKTVKPTVYIACGISGATQHMVGMKGAKNIIAINKDADAPIFTIADLGIVGDVHKVLPKLIEAIKSRS